MPEQPDSSQDETRPRGLAPRIGDQLERVGPYRILERIGEGGMGEVYLAEQREPVRRRVALKVVKWGMDTKEVVARFEAERQALAMMTHPNIAKVFDAGATDKGRPYFVMEHVPGERITDYCDRHRLTTKQRLELFVPVCEAIDHAHQKGVIHRDIKPSNVLVAVQDGKPSPKVIDFGVAKAINQRLTEKTIFTEQGRLIGTPVYMSPEQAEMTGLNVDRATDVYSLGTLMYELLTGRPPFDAKNLMALGLDAMHRVIREKDPSTPSVRVAALDHPTGAAVAYHHNIAMARLERDLRGELDWITMRAMNKDRTRRYASARELAADVQRYLAGKPVVAAPPSLGYRLHRFAKSRRRALAEAAIALATLMVGVVLWNMLGPRGQGPPLAAGFPWLAHPDLAAVAVLPFADLSAEQDREYLADGFAEELIHTLSRIPRLRVTGRTSSFRFKNKPEDLRVIGQALDVEIILEGSVRASNGMTRITVQMVEAENGSEVWSGTYDRSLHDVFEVQEDVARSVAEALSETLGADWPDASATTMNGETKVLVLQARHLMQVHSIGSLRKAFRLLEEALTLDARSAEIWAEMALAHEIEAELAETFPKAHLAHAKAREALERALQLDPNHAVALSRSAVLSIFDDWDFETAAVSSRRALQLSPGNAVVLGNVSVYATLTGQLTEAIELLRRAVVIDPLKFDAHAMLARAYTYAGRFEEASATLDRIVELNPSYPVYQALGLLYLVSDRPEAALMEYERETGDWRRLVGMAIACHEMGRTEESEVALQQLVAQHSDQATYQIAQVYAVRGDREKAFEYLSRAFETRDRGLLVAKADPLLANLHHDGGWPRLLAKIGLSD